MFQPHPKQRLNKLETTWNPILVHVIRNFWYDTYFVNMGSNQEGRHGFLWMELKEYILQADLLQRRSKSIVRRWLPRMLPIRRATIERTVFVQLQQQAFYLLFFSLPYVPRSSVLYMDRPKRTVLELTTILIPPALVLISPMQSMFNEDNFRPLSFSVSFEEFNVDCKTHQISLKVL